MARSRSTRRHTRGTLGPTRARRIPRLPLDVLHEKERSIEIQKLLTRMDDEDPIGQLINVDVFYDYWYQTLGSEWIGFNATKNRPGFLGRVRRFFQP